ncbi:hypothetical protein THAOC_21011, partial [Thalassiosira oceanica]
MMASTLDLFQTTIQMSPSIVGIDRHAPLEFVDGSSASTRPSRWQVRRALATKEPRRRRRRRLSFRRGSPKCVHTPSASPLGRATSSPPPCLPDDALSAEWSDPGGCRGGQSRVSVSICDASRVRPTARSTDEVSVGTSVQSEDVGVQVSTPNVQSTNETAVRSRAPEADEGQQGGLRNNIASQVHNHCTTPAELRLDGYHLQEGQRHPPRRPRRREQGDSTRRDDDANEATLRDATTTRRRRDHRDVTTTRRRRQVGNAPFVRAFIMLQPSAFSRSVNIQTVERTCTGSILLDPPSCTDLSHLERSGASDSAQEEDPIDDDLSVGEDFCTASCAPDSTESLPQKRASAPPACSCGPLRAKWSWGEAPKEAPKEKKKKKEKEGKREEKGKEGGRDPNHHLLPEHTWGHGINSHKAKKQQHAERSRVSGAESSHESRHFVRVRALKNNHI